MMVDPTTIRIKKNNNPSMPKINSLIFSKKFITQFLLSKTKQFHNCCKICYLKDYVYHRFRKLI